MFRLYLIADRDAFVEDAAWLDAIAAVATPVASSSQVGLQVRIRGRFAGDAALARAALRALGPAAARAFLNTDDREASGYAGRHWPEAALASMRSGGPNGASVHSLAALRLAESRGASFAVFGPVFAPSTKPVVGAGIEALRVVASAAQIPLLALGGVTPERVDACVGAGAFGVAVLRGVFGAKDPAAATGRYLDALDRRRPALDAGQGGGNA